MIWNIILLVRYIFFSIFFLWYTVRLTYRRCNSKVCLVGKTAIVTGGNKGIGFETSLALAARGCKVIIGCRSNAEKEKNEIIRLTHNQNIIIKHLDLSSLESARKFAKEIHHQEKKLDILINNAGIGATNNIHTADGLNPTMQTNYFGPFLLTHLLTDVMKRAGHARIVFVSSGLMWHNDLTLENLNYPESIEMTNLPAIRLYANSKLGQVIISNGFAEKLKHFGITSNALHPGTVYTGIYDATMENANISRTALSVFLFFTKIFFKTAEEAAQPSLRVAISNRYKHITGKCVFDFDWFPSPAKARDREFCRKIWEATEEYVKLTEQEKL